MRQAAPSIEIRLLDPAGGEVTGTGPDHPGELYVRSTGVFSEYYKQPESYQAATRGEFHTVGDIAYRDDEGYYYICDRKSDMIISGGMNVYPAEIEAALEQHPGIFDVAVFGIPSEQWGEQVHATVVRSPGAALSEADVIGYAHQHLAGYKARARCRSWPNSPAPARASCSSASCGRRSGPARPARSADRPS